MLGPGRHAAHAGKARAVAALARAAGVDVNRADVHGATPLCVAAQNGHTQAVGALLAAGGDGIDVNFAMHDGRTPLFAAAFNGHAGAVAALVAAHGVAVNQPTHTAVRATHS